MAKRVKDVQNHSIVSVQLNIQECVFAFCGNLQPWYLSSNISSFLEYTGSTVAWKGKISDWKFLKSIKHIVVWNPLSNV